MFIVCPAGWAELRKARGHCLELPGMAACPQHHKPALQTSSLSWHRVSCVCSPPRRAGITPHPATTRSRCGTDPAEAPRNNHSPAPLSIPRTSCLGSLPWQWLGIRLQGLQHLSWCWRTSCVGCRGRGSSRLLESPSIIPSWCWCSADNLAQPFRGDLRSWAQGRDPLSRL